MHFCKVEPHPAYKMKITGTQDLLESIVSYMQTVKHEKYPTRMYGRQIWQDHAIVIDLTQYDKFAKEIICDRGFYFFIVMYLRELKKKYKITFESSLDIKGELQRSPKWSEILRPYQKEAFEDVTKLRGGLVTLYTSSGKSEIFIAIIDSFLNQYPGQNILVTVPKNSIIEELNSRFEQYDMSKYKKGDKDDRLKIINPMGFCRSYSIEDPKWDAWFTNVGLIVNDESHHLGANSYRTVYNKCVNVHYSYGFSATNSTRRLNLHGEFKSFPYEVQHRLGMTGPASVFKFAKDMDREIDYVKIYGEYGDHYPADGVDYFKIVSRNVTKPNFLRCLFHLLDKYSDKVFYLPIPFVEAGEHLYNHLTARGIRALHWTGQRCQPEHLETLEDIKMAMNSGEYRVMIGTSVASEGVDIAGLTAVMLLYGKGERSTPQILGRAGRREIPLVINVFNKEHPLLYKQAKARDYLIKTHYAVPKSKSYEV